MTVTIHSALSAANDHELDRNAIVVDACPGDGWRYRLALTPIPNPEADRVFGAAAGSVLVSLWPGERNSACAVFRRGEGCYLAPSYVAEKLRVNERQAESLAVILGELLDRPHPGLSEAS